MTHNLSTTISIPPGLKAAWEKDVLTVTGPKGIVKRAFNIPGISIALKSNELNLSAQGDRMKTMLNTSVAHIENMMTGAQNGFNYRLAIVFSHFPINAAVKKDVVEINNFIGEKRARIAAIVGATKVEIKGRDIFVSGADKEAVGQTAANLENACRIRGKDRRVFQDGIYIQEKSG
jgi:large subunit ribosomal protein L6